MFDTNLHTLLQSYTSQNDEFVLLIDANDAPNSSSKFHTMMSRLPATEIISYANSLPKDFPPTHQ